MMQQVVIDCLVKRILAGEMELGDVPEPLKEAVSLKIEAE
jgi:hypothetical protein